MKKLPQLSPRTAEQMLENIFLICNKAPNTVSLKTLTAYSNYRKERFSMQRTVIIILLVLFLMLPFLFISTDVTITPVETAENENPLYRITLSSGMPVRHISASINGVTQPIYEDEDGGYTLQPGRNGKLTVDVMLINRQKAQTTASVTGVDFGLPQLQRVRRSGGNVMLFFADAVSGINAAGIAVTDEWGGSVPFQYDTDTGCLTVLHCDENLNIDVPDGRGNVLHLVLSPQ